MSKRPVLIDIEEGDDSPRPDTAPPVPDPVVEGHPEGRAMQTGLVPKRASDPR